MKRNIMLFMLMLVVAQVSAEDTTSTGTPYFKKGDIIVGGKLALGSVYGANVGYVAGVEYGYQDDFLNIADIPGVLGIGLTLGYASYSEDYLAWGKWKYTNVVFLAGAYYHADVLKVENLDTYIVINVGYNAGSVSWDGRSGSYNSPSHGGLVAGTGVGVRYYVSPNLAVSGELGIGMGALRIGVDFKL